MKFVCVSLFIGASWLASARADLTIVQKVEGIGPVSEVTMKIKGDKARVDVNPKMTAIIDGKTGEMINLMHDQKVVMRMSAEKMKAAMEMARQFSGKDEKKETGEKPKFASSGKKEVINGYDTEEYIYETPQFKASYWIASKYPDGAAILKQLQSVNPAIWRTSNTQMPDYRDFPGLPIKTVVSSGGNQITTTLASVKQDRLSDDDFAVPKDYQEMKLPDMSGLQGASPKP
jgi:hypothetical protein